MPRNFSIISSLTSFPFRHGRFLYQFDLKQRPGEDIQYAHIMLQDITIPTHPVWFVNGSYKLPSGTPTLFNAVDSVPYPNTSNVMTVAYGEVVEVVLVNYDPGEHPHHLHGNVFWVVAEGHVDDLDDIPTYFAAKPSVKRDTTTIKACALWATGKCMCEVGENDAGCTSDEEEGKIGYTVIRFVADHPGVWLFHCHIEWHVAAGMEMTWIVDEPSIKANGIFF